MEADRHCTPSTAAARQCRRSWRTGKVPGRAPRGMWWVALSTRGFASNKKTNVQTTSTIGCGQSQAFPI